MESLNKRIVVQSIRTKFEIEAVLGSRILKAKKINFLQLEDKPFQTRNSLMEQ